MEKNKRLLASQQGLTLVEILVSIVILSIIAVSLISIFVQTARSNQVSTKLTDSTTIAEAEMETLYFLSTSLTREDSFAELENEHNYTKTAQGCPSGDCFFKEVEDRYVFIQIKPNGSSIVKVYNDSTKSKKEAQMEMLISWK